MELSRFIPTKEKVTEQVEQSVDQLEARLFAEIETLNAEWSAAFPEDQSPVPRKLPD
jgi:hypothetical protein